MTQQKERKKTGLLEILAQPWAWLFIGPVAAAAGIGFAVQYRSGKVGSLYNAVLAHPLEATAHINSVERLRLRLNRQQLLRIHLTITSVDGKTSQATTLAFHDPQIARLLAVADEGKPVPVLVREDNATLAVLDTRHERWVREGLAQPTAVQYL